MACGNMCATTCGGPSPQVYPGMDTMMGSVGPYGNTLGPMGYPPMGYQEPMGSSMGGQIPTGYPMGRQEPGCAGSMGMFDVGGTGCGGSNLPCVAQGWDLPPQARERKQRRPSSGVPARKIGVDHVSCTTLATPLATVIPDVCEDGPRDQDEIPDHERFDVFTLAFGTKPGSNKPARMLVTLKTPKVLAARLNTNTVATQVGYLDLGLPEPTKKNEGPGRGSMKSRKSRKSKKSKRSKRSVKSAKSSGKGKGKKHKK